MARQEEKIEEVLRRYDGLITYVPLRTEVDPTLLPPIVFKKTHTIPPRPSLSPSEEALRSLSVMKDSQVVILLPGRMFDAYGTRHGQGGGWYDRYLARIPESWLRVGLCATNRFSTSPLTRESHDQPVDIVAVYDSTNQKFVYHITDARSGKL